MWNGFDTIPLWVLNDRHSLYSRSSDKYEFEVYARKICRDDNLQSMKDLGTASCYICKVKVPKAYMKNHRECKKHKTLVKLMAEILRIMENHLVQELMERKDPETIVDSDGLWYCVDCNEIMGDDKKEIHELEDRHTVTMNKDNDFVKQLLAYISIPNVPYRECEHGGTVNKMDDNTDIINVNKNANEAINPTGTVRKRTKKEKLIVEATTAENPKICQSKVVPPSYGDVCEMKKSSLQKEDYTLNLKNEVSSSFEIVKTANKDIPETEIYNQNIILTAQNSDAVCVMKKNLHGISFETGKGNGSVYCQLCEKKMPLCDVEDHITNYDHKKLVSTTFNYKNCIRKNKPHLSHCILCNVNLVDHNIHSTEMYQKMVHKYFVKDKLIVSEASDGVKAIKNNDEPYLLVSCGEKIRKDLLDILGLDTNSSHVAEVRGRICKNAFEKSIETMDAILSKIKNPVNKVELSTNTNNISNETIRSKENHKDATVSGQSDSKSKAKINLINVEKSIQQPKTCSSGSNVGENITNTPASEDSKLIVHYYCDICEKNVPNHPSNISDHNRGKPHTSKINQKKNNIDLARNNTEAVIASTALDKNTITCKESKVALKTKADLNDTAKEHFCKFCETWVPNRSPNILEHEKGKAHLAKVKDNQNKTKSRPNNIETIRTCTALIKSTYNTAVNEDAVTNYIYCDVCKVNVPNILEHKIGSVHLANVKRTQNVIRADVHETNEVSNPIDKDPIATKHLLQLTNNNLKLKDTDYFCDVCAKKVTNNTANILEHNKGRIHLFNVKERNKKNDDSKNVPNWPSNILEHNFDFAHLANLK